MVSFEHLLDVQPEPSTYTVPTMRMRSGDLSEWGDVDLRPAHRHRQQQPRARRSPATSSPPAASTPWPRAYAALYPGAEPARASRTTTSPTSSGPTTTTPCWSASTTTSTARNKPVRATATGTSARRTATTGRSGAANATGEGEINGFEVTHGFDYRSNTGATLGYTSTRSQQPAVRRARRPGRSSTSTATRRRRSIRPRSASRSSRWRRWAATTYLPLHHLRRLQHGTNAELAHRLAGLAALRLGRRLRPAVHQPLARAHRHLARRAATPCARGYELRYQRWDIDNAGYGAGRYHFTGAYTRANNSGAAERSRRSRGRSSCSACPPPAPTRWPRRAAPASQFEIAARRRLPADLARRCSCRTTGGSTAT